MRKQRYLLQIANNDNDFQTVHEATSKLQAYRLWESHIHLMKDISGFTGWNGEERWRLWDIKNNEIPAYSATHFA